MASQPMFPKGAFKLYSDDRTSKVNFLSFLAIVGLVIFAAECFELFDAIMVTLGAVGYCIYKITWRSSKGHSDQSTKTKEFSSRRGKGNKHEQLHQVPVKVTRPSSQRPYRVASSTAGHKVDVKLPSAFPVFAPRFHAAVFELEVMELLSQLQPSVETESLVRRLAGAVQDKLMTVFGDLDSIEAFVTADPTASKAYGVAIPEVEIVMKASSSALGHVLYHADLQHLNEHILHKATLRACTEALAQDGFRFRRSGFASEEPKVTLLVPSALVSSSDTVSMDFFVNAATPSLWSALLADCTELEPKAKALILLVRRWARDRGISHAPKGHLSPYLWGLLTIYFLQRELPSCMEPPGNQERESKAIDGKMTLLPKFENFPRSWKLAPSGASITAKQKVQASNPDATTPAWLFREFFRFYSHFDWSQDIAIHDGGASRFDALGKEPLVVRDPFAVGRNLAKSFTEMNRLKEELARANHLLSQNSSMTLLLEPWAPPEAGVGLEAVEATAPESLMGDFPTMLTPTVVFKP